VGPVADKKKIDPKTPEANKAEKNAARVEKKESLRRKVSKRAKGGRN
jgi:hypothetical protein